MVFSNRSDDTKHVLLGSGSKSIPEASLSFSFLKDPFDATPEVTITQKSGGSGPGQSQTWINIFEALHRDLITYPFYVLRRSIQVNPLCGNYLDPLTAGYLFNQICSKYGIDALTKGFSSTLIVRGLHFFAQRAIGSKLYFSFSIAHVLLIPFYQANFVETVQSTAVAQSCGLRGFFGYLVNMLFFRHQFPTHFIPIYRLILPTITYELLYFYIDSCFKKTYSSSTNKWSNPVKERNWVYETMITTVTSKFVTTVALYPLETILNRLYLQGTRTIIDNYESDFKVLPSISNYEGVFDCYDAIDMTEGKSGFYKGVGFVILQFGIELIALQLLKPVIKKFL